MNHASIISFLAGTCSPEEFAAEIAPEVAACIQGFATGGVGHIIVTDGPSATIGRDHAARLLRALLEERISFDAANYLADGLMMSDNFDFADAAVAEAIEFVADDSRPPLAREMQEALGRLA